MATEMAISAARIVRTISMRGNYRELPVGGQQVAAWLGPLRGLSVPDVRLGPFSTEMFKADVCTCPIYADSDLSRHRSELTRCANNGLMHRSKMYLYSITSSAATSKVCGITRPSALAVLRLITNSNLVGCKTGRSAGFSPLRMRPT
jgi:hypothetical protein